MRKSAKTIREASEAFGRELARQFPGVETQSTGPYGGFDNWIRVLVPAELWDRQEEITHATIELSCHFSDETGVDITNTVVEKEPVHG